MENGKLFLVSTPVGNLKDMTIRAVETLKLSDLILAEDTRVTRKLLSHFNISKELISCHKFNEKQNEGRVVARLKAGGKISLVSDAGTPLLSDPGYTIVKACIAEGIDIEAIPGPSSILPAMLLSGFDPGKFMFYGFLPKKEGERKREIEGFAAVKCPVVIFESPLRVKNTLEEIKSLLGDINAAVAKEMTKVHEKVIRGRISEIAARLTDDILRGEFVIIIDPGPDAAIPAPHAEPAGIKEKINALIDQGMTRSEAAKKAAKELGLKKSDVYRIAHKN